MYHSLSKWNLSKGKKKSRHFCEKYICQNIWLFLRKTRKGRETPPSISVFKQNSSSSQPGCPSTCLEDEPFSKAWLSIPLKHAAQYCLTPNCIAPSSVQYLQKNTLICTPRTIEKLTEMTAIHTALCLQQWKGQTN